MRSDDLRSSLLADPAPRRRIDRSVLFGAAVGIVIGLALVPWAVKADAPAAQPVAAAGGLASAVPFAVLAFAALALVTRRKLD